MTTTVAPLTPEEIAKLRAAYATAGMYEFRASRDTVLRLLDVAESHARLVAELSELPSHAPHRHVVFHPTEGRVELDCYLGGCMPDLEAQLDEAKREVERLKDENVATNELIHEFVGEHDRLTVLEKAAKAVLGAATDATPELVALEAAVYAALAAASKEKL